MQQQRNFVIFITLSVLIITASTLMQTWLNPPKPLQPPVRKLVADPWLGSDLAIRTQSAVAASPGLPGIATAVLLAADAHTAEWSMGGRRSAVVAKKAEKKPDPPKEPPAIVALPPSAPPVEVQLGGTGYKLSVVLTSRGAGVASLTLNQFEAATALGLPAHEPLELLPRELNRSNPSFALFHYGSPDDDRPWDTMGGLDWAQEKKDVAADAPMQEVVFVADVPGTDVRLRKTFSLAPGDYHVGLTIGIERKPGASLEPTKFRYQLTGGHGLPIEGEWYTSVYRNALIGLTDARGYNYRDFQDSRSISHKDGGEDVRKGEKRIQYAGTAVQYFASVIAVDDQQKKKDFLAWARPTVNPAARNLQKPYLDDIILRVVSEPVELKPGESVEHKYVLYHGPVKVRLLAQLSGEQAVDPALVERYVETLDLRTLADYHMPGVMGEFANKIRWTWLLIKCTNVMHGVLWFLHQIVPSYGLCIMLMTLLVRGMMFPISRKQAMTSVKMQSLSPEMKKIQEKFKDDPQGRNAAVMELYRKHGVHPLGSCWIIFLQMPIFLGLYYALQESIHFRLASFLWMDNLAAPDMLIWWSEKIPWISMPEAQGGFIYLGPYFNLLPVIAVSFMLVQQKMLTPPPTDEQQEMQQKMMKWMMVVMGVLFYKVASGLCVYFIVSSLWGMTERKLLPKAKPVTVGTGPDLPPGKNGARKPTRGPKGGSPKVDDNGVLNRMRKMWDDILEQARKK